MLGTILLILVVLILIAALPTGAPATRASDENPPVGVSANADAGRKSSASTYNQ